MKRSIALGCLASILVFAAVSGSAWAGTPAPSFTISAPSVTMTNAAYTPMPFTLTSVNGYVGTVSVFCTPPTTSASVKVPFCQTGPVAHAYTLAADGTATGEADLYAYEDTVPGATTQNRSTPRGAVTWTLAGVVLLGLGLSRRKRLGSGRMLLVMGMLVGLMGMSGCGSNPPTLTPGTYAYTLVASQDGGVIFPGATVTVQVVVPSGIVIPAGK